MYSQHDINVVYVASGAVDVLREAAKYAGEHEPGLCRAFHIAIELLQGSKPKHREQIEEETREAESLLFISRNRMDKTVPERVRVGYQIALSLMRAAHSDDVGQQVCHAIHRMAEIIEEAIDVSHE